MIFNAAIFLLSIILIYRHKKFSVYVLMMLSLLLHKELFSFDKWDLLPIRMFMLALFIVSIIDFAFEFRREGWAMLKRELAEPFTVFISFLLVARALSIFFSWNMSASFNILAFFVTVVFMTRFILKILASDPSSAPKYLRFYIYCVFVLTLFGYFQLGLYTYTGKIIGALWNIPGNLARVGATFWDVNHYGSLIAALLPVQCVFFVYDRGIFKRLLNAVICLSLGGALLLTNSRTAWILAAMAFSFFITSLFVKKFGSRGLAYVLGAVLLVLIPAAREYSIKSSPFRAKIKQYFHYRLDSFDSHMLLLTGAYQVFEKYPILGSGYGSFYEHFSKTKIAPTFFGRDPAALNTRVPAHTIWGELMAETGVIGLTIFLLFSAYFLFALLYAAGKVYVAAISNEKLTIKVLYLKGQEYITLIVMAAVFVGWLLAGIFYSYNSEFFWLVLALFYGSIYKILGTQVPFTKIVTHYLSKPALQVSVIGIISAVLIFSQLGTNHLIPWDEAIYSKIAKNMVMQGEYLTQYWHPTKVWYEKPPLYMWLMSSTMNIWGFTAFAARLPSAILGLGTVLFIYFWGKRLFSKSVGFVSALALVTTTQFLYYARAAMTDVSTTFFMVSGLYFYYFWRKKPSIKAVLTAGLLLGAGVMVKGVVGLLPLLIIALYEVYMVVAGEEKWTKEKGKFLTILAVTSAVVFLPWHFYQLAKFGTEFLENYIGYHVLDRAVNAIEDKGKPIYWYFIVSKVSMRIWFIPLLLGVPLFIFKTLKKNSSFVFITIWAATIFVFFSVAQSKLVWYLIPFYAPAAVIAGYATLWVFMLLPAKFKTALVKYVYVISLTIFSVMYLFFNKALVYTSDLSGSQARLMMKKDAELGVAQKVYLDRIEVPLALFYTDGPYEIIDFRGDREERSPDSDYQEKLAIISKNGRYTPNVYGRRYPPRAVFKDGDYTFWYYDSEYKSDDSLLQEMSNIARQLKLDVTNSCSCYTPKQLITMNKRLVDMEAEILKLQTYMGERFNEK